MWFIKDIWNSFTEMKPEFFFNFIYFWLGFFLYQSSSSACISAKCFTFKNRSNRTLHWASLRKRVLVCSNDAMLHSKGEIIDIVWFFKNFKHSLSEPLNQEKSKLAWNFLFRFVQCTCSHSESLNFINQSWNVAR